MKNNLFSENIACKNVYGDESAIHDFLKCDEKQDGSSKNQAYTFQYSG